MEIGNAWYPYEIARPEANTGAALHVHGVVHHAAAHVLDELVPRSPGHRELLAQVRARRERKRGVHEVGVARHARQCLLHAFELADRQLELLCGYGRRAPVAQQASLPAPVESAGSEIRLPAARDSISMRQPWPMRSGPPMIQSSGMNTSSPQLGPFWNGMLSGLWRVPILTPGVFVGISASVIPSFRCHPKVVGVVELERKVAPRRHRPEG